MNLKTSSIYLLIIFVASQLASCASATPAPEIIISTPTSQPTPTATSAPSETPTPKPTETPTLSPTPETSIAPLTVEELQNFVYETGFGNQVISYDEMVKLANEPLNLSPEDLASRKAAGVAIEPSVDGSQSGHIDCKLGINFFPQFAVTVDMNGIPYRVITSWVILEDSYGQNILKPTVLVFEEHNPDFDDMTEEKIHKMGSSTRGLNIFFGIKDTELDFDPDFYEPLVGENQARTDFKNGVINSETVVLWVRSLIGR